MFIVKVVMKSMITLGYMEFSLASKKQKSKKVLK